MDDLVKFLRDRLDEDERAARRAGDSFRQIGETGVIVATEGDRAEECASANWAGIAEHIVRHDPARILAEVEAKRKLLDEYADAEETLAAISHPDMHDVGRAAGLEAAVRLLALPYAGHEAYRKDWRP